VSGTTPPELEVGLAAAEPGPRVQAPFGRRSGLVSANEAVGAYRLLAVEDPDGPAPLPGQFYMLAAADGWGGGDGERPYLGRAFSVCRFRGSRLEFLLEGIGPGTDRLARMSAGERMLLVGPLGIGFSPPDDPSRGALLVAGGIGVAPIVTWGEALNASGWQPLTLAGFRSREHAAAASLLAGEVQLATDDGSQGHHGFVTELLEGELEHDDARVVYACGPPVMLEAVRTICARYGVPAQLALEETMACGFGACFGCVVRTTTGYRRICVDGPVIAASDLDETWLER
jgi:dihydroorotate dehydrogenase electron transfer subunit